MMPPERKRLGNATASPSGSTTALWLYVVNEGTVYVYYTWATIARSQIKSLFPKCVSETWR